MSKAKKPVLTWEDQMQMLVKDYQDQRDRVVRQAATRQFVPTDWCKELAERAVRVAEFYITVPEDE